MSREYRQGEPDKVRFSIGTRLMLIVLFIMVLSLGSIAVFMSWFTYKDSYLLAANENFKMNSRQAAEAELLLANVRSNSKILIQSINALGSNASSVRELRDIFFTENKQIAALFYTTSANQDPSPIINEQFFITSNLSSHLATSYFSSMRVKAAISQAARGEAVILNAAPYFSRPVLALFYPWQTGGVGGVLFSSDGIGKNNSSAVNRSFIINLTGDIISHDDFTLVRDGTNIANEDFVRSIFASPEITKQEIYESDFGIKKLLPRAGEENIFSSLLDSIKSWIQPFLDNFMDTGKTEKKAQQYVAFTKLDSLGAVVITCIEYDSILKDATAAAHRFIFIAIAILILSIIIVRPFSRSISVPLRDLTAAARRIEDGNFNIEYQVDRKDEVGALVSGFNNMSSALNVFSKFSDREIAVRAIKGEVVLDGLSKHSTVFFSDIREFTAKLEGFTKVFGAEASGKITIWLNKYFNKMIECVERSSGVVDKLIEDSVMAHWGAAFSAGNPRKDAFNCIKAALMMRKALYYMNKERRASDPADPSIHFGCGINSGIVTAGQIGSETRMEYTVIGDPVKIASRIAALAKPLCVDILISEDTWKLVGDLFITEEMTEITVTGRDKPVRIFAIINFTGELKGPQSINDVRSLLGIDLPDLEELV